MSSTTYWKDGSRFTCDPEQAHQELEQERTRKGGRLTAEDVLGVAQSEESVIHNEFTWDDPTAAHEYRLEQARNLTRSLVVVVEQKETRAFESIPLRVAAPDEVTEETRYQNVYVSVGQVRTDPVLSQCVLSRFQSDIERLRKRYSTVEQLSQVFEAIDKALEDVA